MNHPLTIDPERAVLVSLIRAGEAEWLVDDHLDELEALAWTAGAKCLERIKQRKMKPDPATFIGAGKVSEIAALSNRHQVDLVIFDDDLSPVQVRNLEKKIKKKILDRSGLILDIFANRAQTREAKVQVELAQLQYYMPRLTRQWSHLRGSQGGIGFRGPGETQLEVDRRIVRKRISNLQKELAKIAKQRETRRRGRRNVPVAALIGYTNVGKSTLLNTLSGKKDAYVEDKLFATLDAKVRRLHSGDDRPVLLIDTVGFIRKLPPHLVASFRSTLEEVRRADLIVHVNDISHPRWEEQLKQTEIILKSLEAEQLPKLMVFNKIDLLEHSALIEKIRNKFPEAVFISAVNGIRIWELEEKIVEAAWTKPETREIFLRPSDLDLLGKLPESIQSENREWTEGKIRIALRGPAKDMKRAMKLFGERIKPESMSGNTSSSLPE